jgi:FlaA1/EpsC-like NDP-sugar epimerase
MTKLLILYNYAKVSLDRGGMENKIFMMPKLRIMRIDTPAVDIKIVYAGLREGEKLYEELITVGEDILPAGHEKVMVLRYNSLFNCVKNQQ